MRSSKSWLQKTIFGFGLTSLFNDFSHEMVNAILPAFIQQLVGTTYAAIAVGIVSGISDAAASIAKLCSGLITNNIRHYKWFLLIGYAITPLFVGLIGIATTIWQVVFYKTIAWIGKGLREPMRDTWITDLVDSSHYGQAFGFVRALDTIGAIIGPLTTYLALKWYTLKTIFFISFVPGLLSVLALITLTQENTRTRSSYEYFSFKHHIKNLPHSFNYFILTMFIFGLGNFNKLLIIYRAQEVFTGSTISFIAATSLSIILYILFNVIRAISEYSIGTLSDAFNRKNLLAIFGLGFFCITSTSLMLTTQQLLAWLLIFITAGISAGTVASLEKSFAAQLLPKPMHATGFSVLQMVTGIGNLLSSIIVGLLLTYTSPFFGFLYAALLSFIAMILLLFLKEKNRIKQAKFHLN